jgi:hypothetical protein
MRRLPLALVLVGAAAFASGCAGGSSATPASSGDSEAVGAVDGTLVEGVLAGIRPIAHHSFVVSPVSGGVYTITTNAKGLFHFRGRPGVYYPVDSSGFDSHSGLQPFRVVAGKTTHVVVSSVDTSAAWRASANS